MEGGGGRGEQQGAQAPDVDLAALFRDDAEFAADGLEEEEGGVAEGGEDGLPGISKTRILLVRLRWMLTRGGRIEVQDPVHERHDPRPGIAPFALRMEERRVVFCLVVNPLRQSADIFDDAGDASALRVRLH